MRSAGIALVSAACLVAGILAWQGLAPEPLRPPDGLHVQAEIDRLQAEAGHAPLAPSNREALKAAATRRAKEAMARGDARTRARFAAGLFYGAYLANTRARPDWCRRHGVDLAPFVDAYEAAHREERRRAEAILADAGLGTGQFARVDAQLADVVDRDMRDFARDAHLQPRQACALFNERAQAMAQAIVLPPEVRQALFAAR